MSSPSAFERRQGIQGPTGPTGPAGPSGPTGPPSPAITLSGNTAGALALISTGTATIAGGNNITVSQAANAFTISGPNSHAQQTAISGLANSQTTYTSGTVSLSELGAVTIRSTTGNQFQISVAAQSVQPETQTFVGGIANSQTTYTSGTVSLSELGAITIRSTTGNQYQLSVNSQTVQTQNLHNVTLSGNTAGALAAISSGTMTMAGGANITLSQAGNAVTISGAAGGAFSAGMSTEGNTDGNTGVTGSRLVLVGTGPISLSQTTGAAGATLSFNAPATSSLSATGVVSISTNGSTISIGVASTAPQTGVSGIANSQTTYTSGTVSLSELGAITIRSTTGNQYQLSVNAQSVQPETQTFIAGISASDTLYTSGNVRITGLGAITVGSNTGQRIDLSVAAQTNQAGSVYASSNTFGTSSGTYDARSISIAGRGAVSVAASNSGWIISAPAQSTQVETQTFVGGIANSQTTYTSGTVSLSELGAVTIRSTTGNQFQISVNSQTAQTGISAISNSNTTFTSGTIGLSELGAITIRSTTGNQFQFSVNSQTVQTQTHNVTISGNKTSAGAGYVQISTGTMTLAGGNNITLSQDGNAVTISAGAGGAETQTALSGVSNSQTTYTSGTFGFSELANITIRSTTGQAFQFSVPSGATATGNLNAISNSNTTYTSGTIGLSELGAITIRSTTGNQFQFSVNSQTVQTQTHNVSVGGNSTSAGAGYIQISTGTMLLAGGNNITLSQNGASITISAGAGGAATAISGIVASNTTYTSGTVSISGFGGGITVSSNTGQRIDLSVAAPVAQTNQAGSVYGATNTSGTSSGTYDARTLSIAAAGALSVAASNSGWILSAPATSSLSGSGGIQISTNGSTISLGFANPLADWENMAMGNAQLMTHVSGISKTPIYWNDHIDGNLTAKSLAIKISMVTASQPLSVSVHLGVYTFVNSTSAARLGSHSEAYVISSASSVSLSGVRQLIMTGIGTHATLSTISDGEYMFGLMFSATATNAMNFSLYGASTGGGPFGGLYPGTNNMSTGTSQGVQALFGRGSTTVTAMPANVQASELVNYGQGASMQLHPWIYIRS